MARIVIDPGHGGSATIPGDSSWNNAVGPRGTLEKNLTLDIGLAAAGALRASGHDVALTRMTDVNLRLRDRAALARNRQADVFVSIHFNGSTQHNAQGTETLVHTSFSPASAALSLRVQDAVLRVTGLPDRNKSFDARTRIKPQALGVLSPAFHAPRTAACLLEVSFLDDPREEHRLLDPRYRQAIAASIAAGIEAFTGPARAGAPTPMIEYGDSIEVAAGSSAATEIEAFLQLNKADESDEPAPEEASADREENIRVPARAFTAAFVESSGPALSLMVGQPSWPLLDEFLGFIDKLGLQHFQADEFLEMGGSNNSGRCKGLNEFPDKEIWPNIAATAWMLDAIRDKLNAPIRILSCYRAPPYNTCIRGERGSLHLEFNAIDFTCAVGTPEIWRRVASGIRDSKPEFAGGIGVYPTRRFVHIDTRGRAANWVG